MKNIALTITHSPLGKRLKNPVYLSIPEPQTKADEKLQEYIIGSMITKHPLLIAFTFKNQSLVRLAKHLLRHRSGSELTLQEYVYDIYRFSKYLNTEPDQMIKNCQDVDGDPNPKAIAKYNRLIDDYVGELQANELAPGTINGHVKAVKALFRSNGLRIESPYGLTNKVINKDRAPSPEELATILDVAAIREKVIASLLALGGFREGTLCKLKYRHVKKDLEAGIVPLHIHVEYEITKGKYGDYDTFLSEEAVNYLKIYLQMRRRGTYKIPPEQITDESPLIRNEVSAFLVPITTTAVYDSIHDLYVKAGITLKKVGRRYDIRVHSIQKFFRTQLASLNVQADYIEYMMGHQVSTYDVQMKGIEFLRGIYRAAGLCIKPKLRINKMDALKELIRAWGMNPEEILTRDAMTKPNATVIQKEQVEQNEIQQLSSILKQQILKDLKSGINGQ